jgi:RimJ/RimL family protein N-acetyltransferase
MLTARLELRLPTPADRERFVELFQDDAFMVFSGGPLDIQAANQRFDVMLERAARIPFAKQPVVERQSGTLIGYVGVDWLEVDGRQQLEFGYRLVPEARGKRYATEAGSALVELAASRFSGELLVVIHPANIASVKTSEALGFHFWKYTAVDGDRRYIGRRQFGESSHRAGA